MNREQSNCDKKKVIGEDGILPKQKNYIDKTGLRQ